MPSGGPRPSLKKALANSTKLIVADPRRVSWLSSAHLYLPLRVGSDVALLLGMAHVITAQRIGGPRIYGHPYRRWRSLSYPCQTVHATVVGAFRRHQPSIETAAIWYGSADNAAIFYTLGITEHICGVDNVQSLGNLALMTGNLGNEGGGIDPDRGQNNIQGAGDAGAARTPGYQVVEDAAHQAKFRQLYGRDLDRERGITKVQALEAAGESIFAMLIDGENTVVSDPDRTRGKHTLRSLEHLVVMDIFLTEEPRNWPMWCCRPQRGARPMAPLPTPSGAFNGCVQVCDAAGGSQAQLVESSAPSPTVWVFPALSMTQPRMFLTNCVR